MGSTPAGGWGSWAWTAYRVTGGQPFLQPTLGALRVIWLQRTSRVAVRAVV